MINDAIKNFNKDNEMVTTMDMSVLKNLKNSDIREAHLVDISDTAIDVANKNIELNDVKDKCSLIKSNMFEELYKTTNKYDIIVSNELFLLHFSFELFQLFQLSLFDF